MYWYGGWAWMAFMALLWIALIVLAVWAVIRLTHGASGGTSGRGRGWADNEPRESPEEILDRRYASGEIDTDTYTEARERLAAHRPGPRRPGSMGAGH
ncbi:SHOCT domain-containing protein [Streptomyces sp. Li-HN-5-11]|uniref:SHOCT domain-containing protein n=1 Tax=Streptomyces sp. Li-HN-5-11 TaxID=3075432 RepID=UPI0028AA2975|nr:SHOCT domain-containing protein [Streptomyces sp. Li-HN-5-11]WNM32113.1 SHOCT domain-containing protein [Streptomyces sp. Li-HN-5-11]